MDNAPPLAIASRMASPPPRTIVIVEDEFLIRMMLAETLTDDGYHVAEAGTADEALAQLHAHSAIALMITDLSLPGSMDGLALAQSARDYQHGLPIIFVTGRPDTIAPESLGPHDAVVAKPYLPSEIAAQVARIFTDGRGES